MRFGPKTPLGAAHSNPLSWAPPTTRHHLDSWHRTDYPRVRKLHRWRHLERRQTHRPTAPPSKRQRPVTGREREPENGVVARRVGRGTLPVTRRNFLHRAGIGIVRGRRHRPSKKEHHEDRPIASDRAHAPGSRPRLLPAQPAGSAGIWRGGVMQTPSNAASDLGGGRQEAANDV